MKTLSIVAVTESVILENASTVVFTIDGVLAQVDVTEIPSVGTVMSKYFGSEVQVKPVARDKKGRFVSIKGFEKQLIQAGLNSGIIKVQEIDLSILKMEIIKEVVVEPTVEPVKALCMDFGCKEKPMPITRVRGGTHLVVPVEVVTEVFTEVVVTPVAVSVDLSADPFEECNQQFRDESNLINFSTEGMDPNFGQYEEYTGNVVTEEADMSLNSVVKQASRLFYDYFKHGMYIKTINKDQLLKQFSIVWNNNAQLHAYKAVLKDYVFDCIKCYFNTVLGRRSWMTKEEFIVKVIKVALTRSVELTLVA